jgi:2-polyprenyl-3-methyl-5-hydroxy-6-metoxy-1,4-benzoquinol methylase
MLVRRASDLRERMDEPDCDPARLRNTYAQFELVNRLMTGWRRAFLRYLSPRLVAGSTLLDLGCGGGDLARSFARWGEKRGAPLRITAIDPDPRALAFAVSRPPVAGVEYLRCDAEALARTGRRFDCVVSNHVLHHLSADEVTGFLQLSGALARQVALHSDVRRHPGAWLAFGLVKPLFRDSFIVEDGLRSIRRAFTPDELRALLPSGWRHEAAAPFRNLAVLER